MSVKYCQISDGTGKPLTRHYQVDDEFSQVAVALTQNSAEDISQAILGLFTISPCSYMYTILIKTIKNATHTVFYITLQELDRSLFVRN